MWAIIELMGHTTLAGEVFASNDFPGLVQINVPAVSGNEAFTKIVNTSAIYAVTPVTEETAIAKAEALCANPVYLYDLRSHVLNQLRQEGKLKEIEAPGEQNFINEYEDIEDGNPFL